MACSVVLMEEDSLSMVFLDSETRLMPFSEVRLISPMFLRVMPVFSMMFLVSSSMLLNMEVMEETFSFWESTLSRKVRLLSWAD